MPRFAYQVRDSRGSCTTGVVKAASSDEAARQLRLSGSVILDMHEDHGKAGSSGPSASKSSVGLFGPPPVKRDDVIFFANQLAIMVDTGVPLSDALEAICQQTHNPGLKYVLEDITEQVRGGLEFSRALERHPKVFSPLFIAMVRASEATGTLGKMLQRVSGYLEQQRQLRKRVKGAMAYPVMMLFFCVGIVIAMLIFILPRFEKIYAGKKAALPAPTRILLGLSNALIDHWAIILVSLAVVITALVVLLRSKQGHVIMDGLKLHVPVLGSMARKAALTRSLRTLSTMIASGVSVLDALSITGDVAGNIHYQRMWQGLIGQLKEGSSLSEELSHCKLIPQSITQMVSAGERTGKLGVYS